MPDSHQLASHEAPATRDPRLSTHDADQVSDTALALLTLDELRARVRELYDAQRTVERERDALRDAQSALIIERRAVLQQRNDAAATPPSTPAVRPAGLSHDVNNMLGVIIGHVGMALRDVRPSDPLHHDLVAIQQAAERAAALMREMRVAGAGGTPASAPAPALAASAVPAAMTASVGVPTGHASATPRTVLLVEDEPAILTLVTHILRAQGYTVLRSNSATDAIALAAAHASGIDLLLTDVMMPEMNGRDLAQALQARHPGLRTVFMSGYTADLIATRGVLDADVSFLQKPFTIDALTTVVQKALRSAS